jgi:uncharacterized membrane protein (UPF0182 family)
MQNEKKRPASMTAISVEMGAWMLTSFIVFFLFMYGIGLAYRTEYCAFNMVIQMVWVYFAIRKYYLKHPENVLDYGSGILQGIEVSAIGIVGYTVFMMFFLWSNPIFFETIRKNTPLGDQLNPFMASLLILVLGIVIGLIWSYIVTRFLGAISKKEERYVE